MYEIRWKAFINWKKNFIIKKDNVKLGKPWLDFTKKIIKSWKVRGNTGE